MPLAVWFGFLAFVGVMVALDLGVFHREDRAISLPEALGWTALWIALALAFGVLVYFLYSEGTVDWLIAGQVEQLTGEQAALQYFTGYLLEKSLSVDNIFVIAMVFAYFRVPLALQHRVLFWGILGAVVLRGLMIGAGAALIDRFDWIIYVFGGLLLLSAARMLVIRHDNLEPERSLPVRLVRRFYPVTSDFHGHRFFAVADGRRAATPLLLALVLVETSDVLFAVDSIPAIFAVTTEPFLVFTSNVFAILGLRSLYFALAGLMDRFRYLKLSLVFLLVYIGVKMLVSHHHPIPNTVSLAVIGAILTVGILASLVAGRRDPAALVSPLRHDVAEILRFTPAQGLRGVALLLGATVLVLGLVALALPGWAVLLIPLGLGLLAVQLAWARRFLRRSRGRWEELRRQRKERADRAEDGGS